MAQNPDVVVDASYSVEVYYLTMTVGGPLEKPEARQAMCAAFPYDEVISGVFKGYAKRAIGPAPNCARLHPDTPSLPPTWTRRKTVTKAGVAEGTTIP